ncbi:MAG: dihydropteroate synthase [Acidobacteria bacterium]|nr:dihydropteroate synthase [Acidobacteriota bacterium]
MPRKKVEWRIKKELWRLGERTLLCGVIPVTPDAIEGQGPFEDPDRAFVRATELVDAGADILEFTADHLRPGRKPIEEAEELRRLIPALKRVKGRFAIPVSVETFRPAVAEKAIEHGAVIVRDPSGLTLEQELAKVVMKHDVGFILQHMRGTPQTWAKLGAWKDPASLVTAELTAALNRAGRMGVERNRMVVDPGFGMGKRKETNTELLVALDEFHKLHLPLMVSPFNQQFDAEIQVEPCAATTTAAAVMAVLRGAHIIRVMDVPSVRPATLVADQALRG